MAIDRILTGKYTAIPCFIGIMALVFIMTFSLLGAALSDLMGMGIDAVIIIKYNVVLCVELGRNHLLFCDEVVNDVFAWNGDDRLAFVQKCKSQ